MKKLFALTLISVSMMAFTRPPADVSELPATKTCNDGTVVMQDEDCPDSYTRRAVGDDGTIYRETCPLQDQGVGVTGWNIIVITFPPMVIPVPEFGIVCDYGLCGKYPLEHLTGGGGGPS